MSRNPVSAVRPDGSPYVVAADPPSQGPAGGLVSAVPQTALAGSESPRLDRHGRPQQEQGTHLPVLAANPFAAGSDGPVRWSDKQ